MRKMKDSGIAWIGEIAEDFEVIKLKYLCDILDQYRSPITADQRNQDADVLYDYYGASGAIDKIDGYTIDDHVMLIGEDGANLKMRNLPLMYEVNGKAWINNHAHILKPKSEVDFYYLFYALEALDINTYITGSAQPKLSQENLKNIWIPIPRHDVQNNISMAILEKCQDIDTLIEQTRASIDEYKKLKQAVITQAVTKGIRPNRPMKNSGFEWIGDVRSNYRIFRMKNLIVEPLLYGANESGIPYEDDLPRYIRITDISLDGNLKDTGKLSLTEDTAKGYMLADGDILFARSGATVGKSFLYRGKYGRAAFAGYLIRARVNNLLCPELLFYYTQSSIYEEWKKQIFIQSTIQNIGADRYNQLPIIVPPASEQQEILLYINEKTNEIDKLLRNKAKLIELLEKYKKAVIFEYITGKG